MKATDEFYFKLEEPARGSLLALREIILLQDKEVTQVLKYGAPFFCYKGKMFCYFWMHKKFKIPYLGLVEGKHLDYPELLSENRSRIKIFLIDPEEDLPVETINKILIKALSLYK